MKNKLLEICSETNKFVWSETEDIKCPQCGNLTYILRTDERICLTHDKRHGVIDVEFPKDRKEVKFGLFCDKCGQEQIVTKGMADAIDFYLS